MGENWMGHLPDELLRAPLISLAIPGSHDSCANALMTCHPVANDKGTFIRAMGRLPFVRRLILRWATTQRLSVGEQLTAGVRYFDMRISVPNCTSLPDIRMLHALYGDALQMVLNEINSFLDSHPHECVILDFNHFYNFSEGAYKSFLKMIEATFSVTKLCPQGDMTQLSLQWMHDTGFQVIAISAFETHSQTSSEWIWPACSIMSPFPNVNRVDRLIEFLEITLRDHRQSPRNTFYVSQAILTATMKDICLHPQSSLEKVFSRKCTEQAISWLKSFSPKSYFNIVISDFIEYKKFCEVVVSLNFESDDE